MHQARLRPVHPKPSGPELQSRSRRLGRMIHGEGNPEPQSQRESQTRKNAQTGAATSLIRSSIWEVAVRELRAPVVVAGRCNMNRSMRRHDIGPGFGLDATPGVGSPRSGHAVAAGIWVSDPFVTVDPSRRSPAAACPSRSKTGAASATDVKPDDYVKVLKAIDVLPGRTRGDAVWQPDAGSGAGSRRDRPARCRPRCVIVARTLRRFRPCSPGVGSAYTRSCGQVHGRD